MKANKGFVAVVAILVVFVLVLVIGILILNSKSKMVNKSIVKDQTSNVIFNQEVDGSDNDDVVNNDQTEEMKPVSNDNTFSSIEKDIDSTTILEEDFSDL